MAHYEEPTQELIELHKEMGYYPKPDDFESVPTYPEGHHWHGFPRCQAWNAYHGRQCMGLAMVSLGINPKTGKLFDKCKGCGGKAPRGIAAPGFKHGRYSQHLPDRLAEKYNAIVDDAEMMNMRTRAELLETRILEIVENLDEKGSFQLFKDLKEQWGIYEKYAQLARTGAPDRQQEYSVRAAQALTKISHLIKRGGDDSRMWDEIQTITESVRKLADTEQRQIRTAENAVMADRVMVFAVAMASIVRDAIMSVGIIPMDNRKSIIADVEGQVTALLQAGSYLPGEDDDIEN